MGGDSDPVGFAIENFYTGNAAGAGFVGHGFTDPGHKTGVVAQGISKQSYTAIGVNGVASNNSSGPAYGGYFEANGNGTGTRYGLYATATQGGSQYAGYFSGRVQVTGNLSKGAGSFKIDHPLDPANKFLYHSFVESPDMKNIYDGVVELDNEGKAVIELPDYFEALNKDFRYQLACIGSYSPVFIESEIESNQFSIAGGKAGMKVSWQVTGIRKDAFAEANRIIPEVEKEPENRGKYLHPTALGMPEQSGIDWERNHYTPATITETK